MTDILPAIVGILFGLAIYLGIGYGFAVFLDGNDAKQSGMMYFFITFTWPLLATFLCAGLLTHDLLKFFAKRNSSQKK